MERVFISSMARGEMAAVREAAKRAVESVGMVPVMFETTGASERASRTELLERVRQSDVVLLLLGPEYGTRGESGASPTEDEFNAAVEAGRPVLALVQDVGREPEQEEFMWRVRGNWEQGVYAPNFTDASDAGFAVTKALNEWRNRKPAGEQREAATARAVELARGEERPNVSTSGSKLRVVAVPVTSRPLLDAVALEDPGLVDRIATHARSAGLATNAMAVEDSGIDRERTIRLTFKSARGWESLNLAVGADGAVVAEGVVSGEGEHFAGSVVADKRVVAVIEQAAEFARRVWDEIDRTDQIDQVLLAAAVPEAQYKSYATVEPGNRMTMGGMMGGMPHVLVAPDEPLVVRRADLGNSETVNRLRAELKLGFARHDAVYNG